MKKTMILFSLTVCYTIFLNTLHSEECDLPCVEATTCTASAVGPDLKICLSYPWSIYVEGGRAATGWQPSSAGACGITRDASPCGNGYLDDPNCTN